MTKATLLEPGTWLGFDASMLPESYSDIWSTDERVLKCVKRLFGGDGNTYEDGMLSPRAHPRATHPTTIRCGTLHRLV